jgi:hypothetical protein
MTSVSASSLLVLLPLAACSGEPESSAAVKAGPGCSSVRSEHLKAREHIRRRVEEVRAAGEAARRTGRNDPALDGEFRSLMEEIERVEARFAARSKDCVGD